MIRNLSVAGELLQVFREQLQGRACLSQSLDPHESISNTILAVTIQSLHLSLTVCQRQSLKLNKASRSSGAGLCDTTLTFGMWENEAGYCSLNFGPRNPMLIKTLSQSPDMGFRFHCAPTNPSMDITTTAEGDPDANFV